YSIEDMTNDPARARVRSIAMAEMVHVALACNMLNAIGGTPRLADAAGVPRYPAPLPYSIGADGGTAFSVSLIPFSPAAVEQAMHIEAPEDPLEFEDAFAPTFDTIGSFYRALDQALADLPTTAWSTARNQLGDHPFFAGRLFEIGDYAAASRAIDVIVREGEGTAKAPLDFDGEVAHYYRFEEIQRGKQLERDQLKPEGFSWGASLTVDWSAVAPAITNPGEHDFSGDPTAQAAQDHCDRAFTAMLDELQAATGGSPLRLGEAVRAMFDLRGAAREAFATPLAGTADVAGPAFRYRPELAH
nr:ferritin-like protein [Actinomycetota bacterium]